MNHQLAVIKGIHPGFILERELKKRNLKKGLFALSIQEFPQTIVSITKGNRRMNTGLSIKIENALDIEEGFFMMLQVYYDIEIEKRRHQATPDFSKLRSVLFWDTELEKINWTKYKTAVIKRVFERGNKEEQGEIERFYGYEAIHEVLKNDE